VKIAPQYTGDTVHVLDASRAVGVVAALIDPRQRAEFGAKNRAEQDKLRQLFAYKTEKPLRPYTEARAAKPALTHDAANAPQPEFLGRRELLGFPLEEIAAYIDWTFFFTAWELRGKFPRILESAEYGPAARELFAHGKDLLARIIEGRRLTANAVYGFWPANADGDDIVLYTDESRARELVRFAMLRQQQSDGDTCKSLADFVAPVGSGVADHVGAFALTAGIGCDVLVREFEAAHDDYQAIMTKALADRLAEAFAELLHQRARREWGYARAETLTNEQLIEEKYRGIRPAFGYPACPDHTEKGKLFELLRATEIDMTLTESFAMLPAASVSGIYLAHPAARYFNVGRIGKDQVEDYARRKAMRVPDVERWLGPSLGYS